MAKREVEMEMGRWRLFRLLGHQAWLSLLVMEAAAAEGPGTELPSQPKSNASY